MPYFWQTYPAALSARPQGLDVELLPRLSPDTYSDAESRKVYSRLYAWFQKGNYLFRAGQLLRRQVFIVPQSFSGDEAARQATRQMIALIVERTGLTELDAYAICSMCVDLEVTQAVNGTVGVHARLAKSLLRA